VFSGKSRLSLAGSEVICHIRRTFHSLMNRANLSPPGSRVSVVPVVLGGRVR
jgi:hypothetical protein